MCESSTKVFIVEVMGRHAGWIAAAGGLAADEENDIPLIILFPEITFDQQAFLALVQEKVQKHGYVSVVVSEGVRNLVSDTCRSNRRIVRRRSARRCFLQPGTTKYRQYIL